MLKAYSHTLTLHTLYTFIYASFLRCRLKQIRKWSVEFVLISSSFFLLWFYDGKMRKQCAWSCISMSGDGVWVYLCVRACVYNFMLTRWLYFILIGITLKCATLWWKLRRIIWTLCISHTYTHLLSALRTIFKRLNVKLCDNQITQYYMLDNAGKIQSYRAHRSTLARPIVLCIIFSIPYIFFPLFLINTHARTHITMYVQLNRIYFSAVKCQSSVIQKTTKKRMKTTAATTTKKCTGISLCYGHVENVIGI